MSERGRAKLQRRDDWTLAFAIVWALSLAFLVAGSSGCSNGSGGVPNPGLTPDSHAMFFPITSGPHAVDCANCHTDQNTFTNFSCTTGCHTADALGHDDPTLVDRLHPTASAAMYSYTSSGCYSCHPDGSRKAFDHVGITNQCAQCHDVAKSFAALPVANFTHPSMGASDCSACHFSFTSWMTGAAPGGLVADAATALSLDALIPTYSATSIATLTPAVESLKMPMQHATTEVDATAFSACGNCHLNAANATYYPGTLHSSLANLKIAEPAQCSDCHASSMPTGFVGPTATSPARSPASGEMKHDAVAWSNGAPTTTRLVPAECSTCHTYPAGVTATWKMGASATALPQFHASLTSAKQSQPGSCVDCHANTRPTAMVSAAGIQFDHQSPGALGDCNSCHASTSAWAGGQFHLAGAPQPSSCLPCHAGERPTSTASWTSTTYSAIPFDYVTNARSITHGDGGDCASCHGSTTSWVGGAFPHGAGTVASTTCVACHMNQRPTTVVNGFDHSLNGSGDCFGCHQATVMRSSYASLSDWTGGASYPGSNLIGASDQFITLTEYALQRSGALNLISGMTSTSATLYNEMLHTSAALNAYPAGLQPGPAPGVQSTCWHCHTNSAGVVTSYSGGQFHKALNAYQDTVGATPQMLAQPTTLCSDCHTQMRPVGIVEQSASELVAMDHSATFSAAVTIGGVSVTDVSGVQCAVCHHSPGNTWADGVFHANIGGAQPSDCSVCHYPVMADGSKADLTSGTNWAMKHRSTQLTFQSCATCHTDALAQATATPASTRWQGGQLHASVSSQPTACVDCHSVSEPAANASTQSSVTYSLALGGTASNGAQWMNHGVADVAGRDCVVCHASDAKTSGSAWAKSDSFHAVVASPAACNGCHGTGNGGGTVPGTNNNLPAGLTDSSTVSTAGSDATTGVPAGTHDQIVHTDVNVSSYQCSFCHTQRGVSTTAGIQGAEWAQASFHANFNAANPLNTNGTTGRCSSCHMNVKPGASFGGQDHSAFTNTPGSQDCSSCHSWPGTGGVSAPNWLGASGGVPIYLSVGGFPISQPPATSATTQTGIANLPHPTVGSTPCTTCHQSASGGKNAKGYDHASALINTNCGSCHEAGSNLVATPWNNATTQSAGAGDTRAIGLTALSRTQQATAATLQAHFYPVDCSQCHSAPTAPAAPGGIATATTGAPYEGTGTASGSTCAPSGATCPATTTACSATAPCPTGQSCRNNGAAGSVCVVDCPSGQSCQGTACVVDCPGGQSCSNQLCYYPPFWYFPHQTRNMTNPTTCLMCHVNGVPN
jgi:hypothetical protein